MKEPVVGQEAGKKGEKEVESAAGAVIREEKRNETIMWRRPF